MTASEIGLVARVAMMMVVVSVLQYYLWRRLVHDLHLPPQWRRGLTGWMLLMGLSFPILMLARRFHLTQHLQGVMVLTLCYGGFLLITLGLMLFGEPIRWLALRTSAAPQNPQRRHMLQRLVGGTVATLGAIGSGAALDKAHRGPQVVPVEVPLPRLHPTLKGFTVAQISDLHIAPLLGRDYVEETVRRTNALKPQLIVMTGDLIDGPLADLESMAQPLQQLQAPHGVYFVTGNHEYYAGVEPWMEALPRLGVRVLRNECVRIGEGEAAFDLAGIDDISGAQHAEGHGADLAKALAEHDQNRALILLAHQPRMIHQAAEAGVGLMLSGHTHAGQIWPLGWFVRLQQPYVQGLAEHCPGTFIYVNRGTGYVGPPMRLPQPPEISLITLV